MTLRHLPILAVGLFLLSTGCTTTKQFATADFSPPAGNYRMVVMRPDVSVGLLTAGGIVEPREDWTLQARENVLRAIDAQQNLRGGTTYVVETMRDADADTTLVVELNRLHKVVGNSIQIHKYTPNFELPAKKGVFDWTLGEQAVRYGQESGNDYALFLHAEDSFSSGGRAALQAVSMLGCVVGLCFVPQGGQQLAFASLVDLKTGQVVWFNFLHSEVGDIREQKGADTLVSKLLGDMKGSAPASTKKKR
jgi:hypothetical protein